MGRLATTIRKIGRTAQVRLPVLQNLGKAAESGLRGILGALHDPDFEGFRHLAAPPRALILDVGANRGSAARSFWTLYPDSRIVCFEPNARIVERFLGPVIRRGATVHTVALGDTPGRFPLYLPIYSGVVFDGLASLNREEAVSWLNSTTLYGFDPARLEIQELECTVCRLDEFGLAPFILKIDVQGREYEVIAGGLASIAASLPIIVVERESLDVPRALHLLGGLGYRAYRFDGSLFRRGDGSETNLYLIPEEKLSLIATERIASP